MNSLAEWIGEAFAAGSKHDVCSRRQHVRVLEHVACHSQHIPSAAGVVEPRNVRGSPESRREQVFVTSAVHVRGVFHFLSFVHTDGRQAVGVPCGLVVCVPGDGGSIRRLECIRASG